jgi:protein TonB
MRGARVARRLCAFARGYNKFEIPPRFGGIFFRIYMYVMETGSASSLSNKPLFMEPNQIKDADILDILFDGRNKEYGAYELRKTYNRRMVKSMVVMGSVVILVLVGGVVSGLGKMKRGARIMIEDSVNLKEVADRKPVVPLVPKLPPPPVAQIRMVTVRIVPDAQANKKEAPPENAAANDVQIGKANIAGDASGDAVGPPATGGAVSGVVAAPKKTDEETPFIPIEKEAEFPGGVQAWARFLNKTLRYPDQAMSADIQGIVMVEFIVDADGSVSDVKAVSGPEEGGLREEAIRVIKKSGKWVPALQNGRYVRAYRRQPVIFKVLDGN